MIEYIDRESLYKFLSEQAETITGAYSRGRNDGLNIAKSALHNRQITPAADVAPVVRCRDCKHYNKFIDGGSLDGSGYCDEHKNVFVGIHFCSYGKMDGGAENDL